jgi:phosphatidate cytidylyltransferase
MGGDLVRRILFAVPAVAFAAFIIYEGDWIFAAGIAILGVIAVHELSVMLERAHPVRLASMLGVLGMIVAGTAGDEGSVLMALAASVPVTFWLAVTLQQRERITASMSATFLTIVWLGLGVSHAALLRGLDHGGALVLTVLLGTFLGDTAAYLGGRAFGRRKLAPRISPNKTVEGLAIGAAFCTLVVWYWSRTYGGDWISGTDGLLLGIAVAIAAPTGDLFESLIKRDMGTKDTGTLFGPHGGVLDRVDAALFALVAGYYVWIAVA